MHIHSIQLQTANLSRILDFYINTLGLAQTGGQEVRAGSSRLTFQEDPAFSSLYHFAFSIPCNQIRPAMAWLERRGITLVPDPGGKTLVDFSAWEAEAIYFFDPDGNIVEFIARRGLQNESHQPFGPEAILGISEIGIVTDDVLAWNARAAAKYGILPFERSKPGPDFSALGTDSGLFIVVPEGRTWYMTDQPATDLPLVVEFENGVGERFTYSSYDSKSIN